MSLDIIARWGLDRSIETGKSRREFSLRQTTGNITYISTWHHGLEHLNLAAVDLVIHHRLELSLHLAEDIDSLDNQSAKSPQLSP